MRKRTFRIYRNIINTWTHIEEIDYRGEVREVERATQYEIEYMEFDSETFEVVAAGTEDFSKDRFHKEMLDKLVYTWNGEKRNAGGHRWFEHVTSVKYRRGDAGHVKAFYKNKYNAAEIELR